jgi:hypothetical protein
MLIALVKSFTDVHDLRGPIEYRRYGTGWYRSTEYDGTESTRDTILSSTCYLLLLTLVLIILLSPHGKMRDCVYIRSTAKSSRTKVLRHTPLIGKSTSITTIGSLHK